MELLDTFCADNVGATDGAGYGKALPAVDIEIEKEKATPLGINLMRSQV